MNADANELAIVLLWVLVIMVVIYAIYDYCKNRYIKKNSYLFNKLLALNKETNIKCLYKELAFEKRYDYKSSLDRAELNNVAIFFVNENLDEIRELIKEFDECQRNYFSYDRKYKEIINEEYDSSKIHIKRIYFRNFEKYRQYELKLCEDYRIKNRNAINMHIKAYYISPQRRNYWHRDARYNAYQIKNMISIIESRENYQKSIKYQRDIMTDSLRYKILKRDGFKCSVCGASAKLDGVKLEVDHIIPVSKGGLTVESNLQTLCERCNRGKSNKY